jgi:hypothetical protein
LFFPDITDRGLISDVRIALNLSLFRAGQNNRRKKYRDRSRRWQDMPAGPPAAPRDVFRKAQIYHVGRFVRICRLRAAAKCGTGAALAFH